MRSLSSSALARRLLSSLDKREPVRDRLGNVHEIKVSQLPRRSPATSKDLITVHEWRQWGRNERETRSHLRSSLSFFYIRVVFVCLPQEYPKKWFKRNNLHEGEIPQLQDGFPYVKHWKKYPKIARNPKAWFLCLQVGIHKSLASS